MIARIKVMTDHTGADGQEAYGREFVALITKGKGFKTATFDNGDGYTFPLYNYDNMAAQFEILEELQVGEVKEVKKEVIKEVPAEVKRADDLEGYVMIPMNELDTELAKQINDHHKEIIITPREMVAMFGSSLMEINKGDVGSKSLNVKLYKCLSDFVDHEVAQMIEGGKQ